MTHHRKSGPSSMSFMAPCLLALIILGFVGGRSTQASSRRVLLARPETGTLHGMRAISRLDDGTFRDESAHGMRVGTSPAGEERRALFKPAFVEPVEAYRSWRTKEVGWQIANTSCTMSRPLHYWGADTPSSTLWSMPTTTVSTAYLRDVFDRILETGGNYASTEGFFLQGEGSLAGTPVDITFFVTIRDEADFIVQALDLVTLGDDTLRFSWRSSRRGHADIYVNGIRRIADQFTVANRINRSTIYGDWLETGTNEVYVTVREPSDLTSTAASESLTMSW